MLMEQNCCCFVFALHSPILSCLDPKISVLLKSAFLQPSKYIYGPVSPVTMKEGIKQKRTTTMGARGSDVLKSKPSPWQMYPLYFTPYLPIFPF